MSRLKVNAVIVFLTVLAIAASALGQQASAQSQATTPPAPVATPARTPDYVEFTGFNGKVFDVKYREPRVLVDALRPLGSGFKGATISWSDEFRTLTVRDFPENIAAIEEAIKRLDTPQPVQPDIELRMHVLIASNVEGVASQYPPDLADVLKQIQATLNYKSYSNVASVIQRVRAGSRNVNLTGTADIAAKILEGDRPLTASYEYRVHSVALASEPSGGYSVQIGEQEFVFQGPGQVGRAVIRTDLNLRNGEKLVVGTATLGNKGLILVLSARVIK
jgi:hypothetical protein